MFILIGSKVMKKIFIIFMVGMLMGCDVCRKYISEKLIIKGRVSVEMMEFVVVRVMLSVILFLNK